MNNRIMYRRSDDALRLARAETKRALCAVLWVILLALLLTSCASVEYDRTVLRDSHNESGGYRDACGELPPLLGDDC